ncbi:hypothetical protein YC2023_044011 [Brassica napus]
MVRAYGQITLDELILSGPESLECIRGLRKIRVKVVEMNGVHLVAYPIRVMRDGAVEDILIPKQLVEGKKSKMLPPMFSREISGTSFQSQIKLTPNNMSTAEENLHKVFYFELAFSTTRMYLFSPKGAIAG